MAALSGAACAASPHVALSVRENPDMKTLVTHQASMSNGLGDWRLVFSNRRGHGKTPRTFAFGLSNGVQWGFTGLVQTFALSVNGIDASRLQLGARSIREFAADGLRGVELILNFDGAPVRLRFWMAEHSPRLEGEIRCSRRGIEQVTNMAFRVTAVPSFLDCGKGRATRFSGYRRAVRTSSRTIASQADRKVPMLASERWFAMTDEDFDGSGSDRGAGPCAVMLEEPCYGDIAISGRWTTELHFRPDPARPFRFSLVEKPGGHVSNDMFVKEISR